jgi:hypothetical protein
MSLASPSAMRKRAARCLKLLLTALEKAALERQHRWWKAGEILDL